MNNAEKELFSKGVKYDTGKPEFSLLPPNALLEMVENLTFGARKYSRDNWRKVPDAKRRYFDAAMRHLWAWKMDERFDPENHLHHLAAASVNIMFILELDLAEVSSWREATEGVQPLDSIPVEKQP